jgi:succinoglycan biosynthesis protein ExoA
VRKVEERPTSVDDGTPSRDSARGTVAGIARVSIIVPMLNEEAQIEGLLADIAAQTFTGDLELLVADGGSTDRSVERLRAAAARHEVALTVIENPGRLIPHALNACVRRARGELIVRMDCRARFAPDYVARCIAAAEETGAWNVGGRTIPVGRTRTERAVGCATDSPFGGIGWTRMGSTAGRVEVDTVYCGVFRRDVFDRVGLFDEALPRNEDEDLNFRIRRAGGQVILDSRINVLYTPKGSVAELFRQYSGYGQGKVDLMRKHGRLITLRSVVPLAFVGSLAVLAPVSIRSRRARAVLLAELSAYSGCALGFGLRAISRRRESLRLLPQVVVAFPVLHAGYGTGMLRGLAGLGRRTVPRARLDGGNALQSPSSDVRRA